MHSLPSTISCNRAMCVPCFHSRREILEEPTILMLETQIQLFDTFLVTPGNIIYADERNPFDLYRTLSLLQGKYRMALRALDPTTIALSTHSSKLLSLGALLAAYEHGLPIVAAPALDYELEEADPSVYGDNRVACAWLAGLPY